MIIVVISVAIALVRTSGSLMSNLTAAIAGLLAWLEALRIVIHVTGISVSFEWICNIKVAGIV